MLFAIAFFQSSVFIVSPIELPLLLLAFKLSSIALWNSGSSFKLAAYSSHQDLITYQDLFRNRVILLDSCRFRQSALFQAFLNSFL